MSGCLEFSRFVATYLLKSGQMSSYNINCKRFKFDGGKNKLIDVCVFFLLLSVWTEGGEGGNGMGCLKCSSKLGKVKAAYNIW